MSEGTPSGSPEPRPLAGGHPRTVLMWLARVLVGRATGPQIDHPRTV